MKHLLISLLIVYLTNANTHSYKILFECNKPTLYFKNNYWLRDNSNICPKGSEEALKLCKKYYPQQNIVNISPAKAYEPIQGWCFNSDDCKNLTSLVKPILCLTEEYSNDLLKVPRGCFLRETSIEENSNCQDVEELQHAAERSCRSEDGYINESQVFGFCYDSLKNIIPGRFQRAEYVCCPANGQNNKVELPDFTDTNYIGMMSYLNALRDNRTTESFQEEEAILNTVIKNAHFINTFYDMDEKNASINGVYENFKLAEKKNFESFQLRFALNEKKLASFLMSKTSEPNWLFYPKAAQTIEDKSIMKFREESDEIFDDALSNNKRIWKAYQEKIRESFENFEIYVTQIYTSYVEAKHPKLLQISDAIIDLIRMINSKKTYLINMFEFIRKNQPEEAREKLEEIKVELNRLSDLYYAQVSLLKNHPKYELQIMNEVENLNMEYAELDADVKALQTINSDAIFESDKNHYRIIFQEIVNERIENLRHKLYPVIGERLFVHKKAVRGQVGSSQDAKNKFFKTKEPLDEFEKVSEDDFKLETKMKVDDKVIIDRKMDAKPLAIEPKAPDTIEKNKGEEEKPLKREKRSLSNFASPEKSYKTAIVTCSILSLIIVSGIFIAGRMYMRKRESSYRYSYNQGYTLSVMDNNTKSYYDVDANEEFEYDDEFVDNNQFNYEQGFNDLPITDTTTYQKAKKFNFFENPSQNINSSLFK